MGRYNPWWEECTEPDPYSEGYDDGYAVRSEYRARLEVLEKRCEQLEGLLSANVRVIKKEIQKELEEKQRESVAS